MNPLLVIVGPTAVGKTEFSLSLAKLINGEIISADSMQIYKKMTIGTAKPSLEERAQIPHHLIDCVWPDEDFTVSDFQKKVEELIPQIVHRGSIPMMVGGTGLYIQAVTDGFIFPEMETDWKFREEMHQLAKRDGNESVHARLNEIDPELAQNLHPNDLRRVIRGLEIYQQTGKPSTYYKKLAANKPPKYDTIKIGLNRERGDLYQRINCRVELMVEMGLIKEVKELLADGYSPDLISMQGLGYKEIVRYLQGQYDLDEAVYLLKRNTRHFAKRQLTWFKRDKGIFWFNLGELSIDQLIVKVKSLIEERWQ